MSQPAAAAGTSPIWRTALGYQRVLVRATTHRATGSGRWKGSAALPQDWSASWSTPAKTLSRSPALGGHEAQAATSFTPLPLHGRRWHENHRRHHGLRGLREALGQVMTTRQAVLGQPYQRRSRFKSLIVVAPEHLRACLRGRSLAKQLEVVDCSKVPSASGWSIGSWSC